MNDDARDLGAVLADFAKVLADEHGPTEVLHRLGSYCTELFPIHGVGVLLRTAEGGIQMATANTAEGRAVEELEAGLGEGPCTECMATGEQILAPDVAALGDRYPRFVPRAVAVGIRSIHALPMTVRGEQLGAMDMVATDVTHLDANQLATAQVLADVAVTYLAHSRALDDKTKLATQLQHALDSRIIIEQAKGILAERHQLNATAAFDRLRSYARNNQRKLHEVAGQIVQGGLDV